MGLIQAVTGAIGGMLADQWKDFYTVPDGLAADGGAVRRRAAGQERRTRFEHRRLEHHHQRLEDRRARRLRPAAVPGRRDHRLRRRAGRLRMATRDDLNSKSIFAGDGIVEPADQAELGALQVRRPAGFAAGGLLRLAEGAAGQPLRHPVGDLLGRRLPQHPGRRGDARLLHAEDRRPDPVREELRAGRRTCSPARSSTSPTWTTPPPASCSTKSSARSRRRFSCTRTTRPRATASPSCSRIRSASPRACPRRWRTATSGTSDRGLAIVKTAIVSIEYDANTRELLEDRAARRRAVRFARQLQPAGQRRRRHRSRRARTAAPAGLIGHGHGRGHDGRHRRPAAAGRAPAAPAADDPVAKLKKAKEMLDLGLITQARLRRAQGQGAGSVSQETRRGDHVEGTTTPPTRCRPTPARDRRRTCRRRRQPRRSTRPRCPQPIRDELERPTRSPSTPSDERAQGRRQPLPEVRRDRDPAASPAATCWSACSAATSGRSARVEEEFGLGEGIDQLEGTVDRLRCARHRRRRRQPDDASSAPAAAPR